MFLLNEERDRSASYEIPDPTNKDIFSLAWHRRIARRINSLLRITPKRGAADGPLIPTDDNCILPLSNQGGSGAGAPSSNDDGTYVLKSVQGDYVTCRTYDGTTVGSTDIYIAKPYKIRAGISSTVIFTVTHSYTYSAGPDAANPKRHNSDGTNSEDEYVTPPWIPSDIIGTVVGSDIIYAIPMNTLVNDGGGNPIMLLMVDSARQWAAL